MAVGRRACSLSAWRCVSNSSACHVGSWCRMLGLSPLRLALLDLLLLCGRQHLEDLMLGAGPHQAERGHDLGMIGGKLARFVLIELGSQGQRRQRLMRL